MLNERRKEADDAIHSLNPIKIPDYNKFNSIGFLGYSFLSFVPFGNAKSENLKKRQTTYQKKLQLLEDTKFLKKLPTNDVKNLLI